MTLIRNYFNTKVKSVDLWKGYLELSVYLIEVYDIHFAFLLIINPDIIIQP